MHSLYRANRRLRYTAAQKFSDFG